MRRLFFPLIFSLVSISANATEVQSRFLALGTQIPSRLIEMGYSHLGLIQLDTFIEDIKTVSVRAASMIEIAESNCDGRVSARWNKGKGIMVNGDDVDRYPEQAAILALHEYLSIRGYYDEEYWISMSMWFLSLKDTQELLSVRQRGVIESWIARNSRVRYAKGSVVGVGGGGELATLWVRTRRFKDYLADLRKSKSKEKREEALNLISIGLRSQLTVSYPQAAKKCR